MTFIYVALMLNSFSIIVIGLALRRLAAATAAFTTVATNRLLDRVHE